MSGNVSTVSGCHMHHFETPAHKDSCQWLDQSPL